MMKNLNLKLILLGSLCAFIYPFVDAQNLVNIGSNVSVSTISSPRSASQCIEPGGVVVNEYRHFYFGDTYTTRDLVPKRGNGYDTIVLNQSNVLMYNSALFNFSNPIKRKSNGIPSSASVSAMLAAEGTFTVASKSGAQLVYNIHRAALANQGSSTYNLAYVGWPNLQNYTATLTNKTFYNQAGRVVDGYECVNYIVHYCGDGTIDTQSSIASLQGGIPNSIANEQCDGNNGVPAGYTCNAQCQLVPNTPTLADLSVTKTVNNPTPTVGSNVTFTMVLSNAGPANAGGVTLTDILPSGYTYVSHTASQGTYNPTNGIRNVGTINIATTKTLSITAQVKAVGNYVNTIEVTSSDKQDPDSTPNNHNPYEDDQASATVTPSQAAPSCVLTVSPSNIVSGSVAAVSWSISGSVLYPTHIFVSPAFQGAFPFAVNNPTGITYAAPTVPGVYTFSMTVVNTIGGLQSTCTANLTVGQAQPQNPILTIQKTLLVNKTYYSGDQIGFRINFQNNGLGTATNVVLTDILPSSLSYVSSAIYGVNANLTVTMSGANPVISYNGFNLAPGASGYMIITGVLNTNNAQNNRTNYTDIYAFNHPLVSATALFPVGEIPSNNVLFTKVGNKSTYQPGESITFTITTTNNGPADINDLTITDTRPSPSCITYTTRSSAHGFVNNGNMSWFRSGTLAVGQSVSLILNGVVSSNPACAGSYTNVANLNYYVFGQSQNKTASYPFNVLAGSQCQSLTSVYGNVILMDDGEGKAKFTCTTVNNIQANIRVECGNGTSFNGFGNTLTDYCEYDDVGPYTVRCYVDNTTNEQCTETIIVDEGMLGYCGDGIIQGYEDCDLGGTQTQRRNGITIHDYLDSEETVESDDYEGYKCTNCAIKGQDAYEAPACNGISTTLSVQKGEILPFRRDLEGNNIVNRSNCNAGDNGKILGKTLECTFKIFNGKSNLQYDDDYTLKVVQDCDVDQREKANGDLYEIFKYFDDHKYDWFYSLQHPFGRYYFTVNDFLATDKYGEYKLTLDKVSYEYCDGTNEKKGTEVDRICEVDFALTKPYLMQKSLFGVTPKATTEINLDQFYDMKGYKLINTTDLASIMEVDANDYDGGAKMDKQIVDFINKYTKLSTKLPSADLNRIADGGTITEAKKVPGKQIYIIKGSGKITFKNKQAGFTKPFTMIIKGMDVIIEGSLKTNGMFVVQGGKITFSEDPSHRCEQTQTVQGIFISDQGFGIPSDFTLNLENDLNKPRCPRGGLNVKGVLIGNNIGDLVKQRRSQLNDWFLASSNNINQIKIERRNKIFKGASVLIEYSPSLRGALPPGASDFTKILEVYKK